MRIILMAALTAGALATTACNTARGVGRDVKSIGRVFSHDPNGDDSKKR